MRIKHSTAPCLAVALVAAVAGLSPVAVGPLSAAGGNPFICKELGVESAGIFSPQADRSKRVKIMKKAKKRDRTAAPFQKESKGNRRMIHAVKSVNSRGLVVGQGRLC